MYSIFCLGVLPTDDETWNLSIAWRRTMGTSIPLFPVFWIHQKKKWIVVMHASSVNKSFLFNLPPSFFYANINWNGSSSLRRMHVHMGMKQKCFFKHCVFLQKLVTRVSRLCNPINFCRQADRQAGKHPNSIEYKLPKCWPMKKKKPSLATRLHK